MDWKTLLAYITGSVDEQLLLRIEYLAAENGILRNQIKGRLHLSDTERTTLAELGKKLGKRALEEVAKVATPDTILGWHRKLVAQKCDGSTQRKSLGCPRVDKELEDLVVRMAQENRNGAMIAWPVPWRIWGTTSVIKRLGTFSSAVVCHQRPSGRRRPPGERSSARIWRCYGPPTSSPPRCGRWVAW